MKILENGKIIVDDLNELRNIVREKKIPLELIDIKESRLTSLALLFRYVEEINGSIDNWDVSNIQSMNGAFQNSNISNLNISKWNVSNVIIMQDMFIDSKFNGDISSWDISKVENMEGMFYNTNFNGDKRFKNNNSLLFLNF